MQETSKVRLKARTRKPNSLNSAKRMPMSLDFIEKFMAAARASEKRGGVLTKDPDRLQWLVAGLIGCLPANKRDKFWCWLRLATILERIPPWSDKKAQEKLWASSVAVLFVKRYPRHDHFSSTLRFQRDMLRSMISQVRKSEKERFLSTVGPIIIPALSFVPCYCEYLDRHATTYQQNVRDRLLQTYQETTDEADYELEEAMILSILSTLHNTTPAAIRKRLTHPNK